MASGNPLAQSKKQKAYKFLNQGRIPDAVALLEQVIHKYPTDIEAMSMLGNIYGQSGQLEAAIHYLQRVIEISPKNIQVLNNLGVSHMMLGNTDKARMYIERVLQLQPGDAGNHFNLGCILQEQKHLQEAIKHYRQALQITPDSTDILINLGVALKEMQNNQEAKQTFLRVVEKAPDNADACYNLGIIFNGDGDKEHALEYLTKTVQLRPDYVNAHLTLGNIFLKAGDKDKAYIHYEKAANIEAGNYKGIHILARLYEADGDTDAAIKLFLKAIEINHSDARLYRELGYLYQKQGRTREALQCLEQARGLDPNDDEAIALHARILYSTSAFHAAISLLQRGLELNPDNDSIHAQLATHYHHNGEYDKALKHARRAQVLQPENQAYACREIKILAKQGLYDEATAKLEKLMANGGKTIHIALSFANLCKRMRRCDEAIDWITELLDSGNIHDTIALRDLIFERARLYDSAGQYNKAFTDFLAANKLKETEFSCGKHHAYIDNLIATYSRETLATCSYAENESDRPIFIVGMPRSGTSLTEQILTSHHAIDGAGELGSVTNIYQDIKKIMAEKLQQRPSLTIDECNGFAQDYLDDLSGYSSTTKYITDKMPTNFLYLGLIQQLFPKSRVIHTLRNPMDTCLSIYTLDFSGRHDYAYDLENLGCFYNEYRRIIKHWYAVLDIPIMTIQYEDLVNEQETWSRKLIEFCGLEWDDACLDFHKSNRVMNTASNEQVRQPIYKKSIQRWRNYEKHLQPLIDALEPEYRKESGVENWDY